MRPRNRLLLAVMRVMPLVVDIVDIPDNLNQLLSSQTFSFVNDVSRKQGLEGDKHITNFCA